MKMYVTDMTHVTGAEWVVKTDDPKMIRRLNKTGEFLRIEGRRRVYSLAEHQVQLRTRREPRTAEEKMKLASTLPHMKGR